MPTPDTIMRDAFYLAGWLQLRPGLAGHVRSCSVRFCPETDTELAEILASIPDPITRLPKFSETMGEVLLVEMAKDSVARIYIDCHQILDADVERLLEGCQVVAA